MSDAVEDRPGRVLSGRYELVEQLGHGGMAVVWQGIARGADGFTRPVAIKRIDASCRGFEEVIDMFVEEARVGGRLQHPNIVQVYDFGIDEGGERYLVTELVRGLHLREWVNLLRDDGGPPAWELVAAVGVEVLRGLDAAHSHLDGHGRSAPILHRDVTPTNILLDLSGVVKLADFGLARAGDRARMTRPNVVKGKLAYLAPELLAGKPPSIATDIFSLGVVLWEALTGKRLFDAPTDLDVVKNVQRTLVPLLSRERPSLPLGISELVHRALAREPEQRFESARTMLEALTEILRILPRSVDAPALGASVQHASALKRTAKSANAADPPP
jgi:serine/threonine-protein kinase